MKDHNENIIVTKLYHHVLKNIFGGFIRQEAELLQSIKGFGGSILVDKETLTFTLPALFEFACESFVKVEGHNIHNNQSNYLCFRKTLYSNPTNRLLQQQGGCVELAISHSDLNKSQYKLVLLSH